MENRIDRALAVALAEGSLEDLFDAIDRRGGMPGPRPNLVLLRSVGVQIAEAKGGALVNPMLADRRESVHRTGLYAIAAIARTKGGVSKVIHRLHDLADEPEKQRRDAVIDALAEALAIAPDEGMVKLASFTDGFLHAFVAIEAATDTRVLSALRKGDVLIERLSEAFQLAHEAPRSADRAQGVRQLRQGFATQIARIAPRFDEVFDFVDERILLQRPETREIMHETISKLRKVIGESKADRLRKAFEAAAPVPRDLARIVKGTRKRSKGRD